MSLYQGPKLSPKEIALARAKETIRLRTLTERAVKTFGGFNPQINKSRGPVEKLSAVDENGKLVPRKYSWEVPPQ